MHLEDAMPISLAVNLFSWNAPPDNKPMIDCEDIDVYFEVVDQHNTNQDEILEKVSLLCHPMEQNKYY